MKARIALAILVVASSSGIAVVLATTVPVVRDALAVALTVALVTSFVGLRLLGSRLRHPDDREFDFWGGMAETGEQAMSRYRRPGANPILPPDLPPGGSPPLPDDAPTFQGHSVGLAISPEDPDPSALPPGLPWPGDGPRQRDDPPATGPSR